MLNSIIDLLNKTGSVFCQFSFAMLLQSTILILLLLLIDLLIKNRARAVLRYCIWMLLFIKLILPASLSLPTGIGSWAAPLLPSAQTIPLPAEIPTPTSSAVSSPQFTPEPTAAAPQTPAAPSITPQSPAPVPTPAITSQAVLFLAWLTGVSILSLLLIQRFIFVKALLAQTEIAAASLLETLRQCCLQAGTNPNIELRLSKNMLSPAACGLIKPIILMPAALIAQLPADKLRPILIHELAHIKRLDLWVNFAQTILQILYFYNPLLWLANSIVRRIREKAVDEFVLTKLGADAASYSSTLLDIAELAFSKPHFSLRLVGVVESKKALTSRIKHILSRPFPKSAKLSFLSLITIILTAAVLLPMAKAEKPQKNLTAENSSTLPKTGTVKNQNSDSANQSRPAASGSGKHLLVGRDYTKIQDAINAAKLGDTIQIMPGVYEESLILKDGVNLDGGDGNNVVIQCDMRISPVLSIENCKSVHISRLTLKHYNPLPMEDDADGKWPIVQIGDSGVLLNHLVVCGSASQGIRITNGRKNYDLVSVVDSTIYNNRSAGITVSGNGNAELKNNTFADNKKSGICFKEDADGRVSGNLCKNNAFGIAIQDNAVVEVSANTCCGNKSNGIWFESKSPFNVSDNNCFDNGTTGIEINSQIRVSAVKNNCRRNGINGIYLRNGVTGIVSENICAENKWHGISVDKYSRPTVENNKCFANKKCGIYDDGAMIYQNKTYNNKEFHWQEVHMYLRAEDFNELEKMASLIRNEKRRFASGNWQLNHFYYSFGSGFGQHRFDDNIKLIEKWISKYPASVTPRIALASALRWQAWNIRGTGFSFTVSPTAWEPFEQLFSKALDVLKEAEKLNTKDPALYTEWVSVATGMHKMDDIESAFKKGIAIEPTYYPIYDARCWAYLPRWYGKPGQYEQLAGEAAESTKNEMGQSLYFLLAGKMTQYVEDMNQFRELGFDYKRIKQGQKDFVKQFPECQDIEFLNRACFIACAAGDKEDAKNYLIDIGDQWQKRIWKNEETFNKYKSWVKNNSDITSDEEKTMSKNESNSIKAKEISDSNDKSDPQAAMIFEKMLAKYKEIKSFSAVGEINSVMDMSDVNIPDAPSGRQFQEAMKNYKSITSFTIKLSRPNLYLVKWQQKSFGPVSISSDGAVWNAGEGDYLFLIGQKTKQQNTEMALASATGVSGGASATIPSLFFNMHWGNVSHMQRLSQTGEEKINGDDCFVISGKLANIKHRLWISKKTFLICQIQEIFNGEKIKSAPLLSDEIKTGLKAVGKDANSQESAKMREEMQSANRMVSKIKGTTTETYRDIKIDEEIPKEKFAPDIN